MNADATIRAVPAVSVETPLPSGADQESRSRPAEDAERQARYRLVIEQGPSAGSFVYKTLDRETGEIVRQLPSEEVLKLRQRDDYGVGAVINTTA
ncbi:MAG: flagellar protein FlaG [Brevundimonas sp.]|nr:flagellar protein FlaG [Brevundimonas sp.]